VNKNVKLKGANIDTVLTLMGIVCCVLILWSEFARVKGAEITLHMKSLSFRAAKLKVLQY